MAYVKWVANADRHNDWTSELNLEDGTVIRQGEPVDLNADVKKSLEADGRIFTDSSKAEADEYATGRVTVGGDVAGSAPLLVDQGPFNQPAPNRAAEQADDDKNDKK